MPLGYRVRTVIPASQPIHARQRSGCRLAALSVGAVVCLVAACGLAQGPVSLHASVGASVHGWDSGMGRSAVVVETEPLKALRLEGALGWRGRPLLKFEHAQTLEDSPLQEEMLAASRSGSTTLTETLGYLDLLAMIVGSERFLSGDLPYFQRLLGLKIVYSQDLYHAATASPEDFAYVSFRAPEEVKAFEDGDQLGFKTTFRDLRISTPVWFDPVYAGAVIRVGYFQSRWEKVAEVPYGTYGGDPLLQDTRLDTAGLTVSYDNRLEWPGLGWIVGLDLGFLGSGVSSPVPLADPGDDEAEFSYGAVRAELRWNLVDGGARGGLAATFGAGFELRGWDLRGQDIDRDLLTRIFGRVGFDLAL